LDKKNRRTIKIILILLLLLLLVFFIWLFGRVKFSNSPLPDSTNINSTKDELSSSDTTIGWGAYQNDFYKIRFKYPEEKFSIKEEKLAKNQTDSLNQVLAVTLQSKEEKNQKIVIALYENPGLLNLDSVGDKLASRDKNESGEEKKGFSESRPYVLNALNEAGKKVAYQGFRGQDGCCGQVNENVIINGIDHVIKVTYSKKPDEENNLSNYFEQILSSVKLLR